MSGFVSVLLTSVAVAWLLIHWSVQRKLRALNSTLPAAYRSSIVVPPETDEASRLMPLAVDLMRKRHCTIEFDALTSAERRIVLHAHAIDKLPRWMVNLARQRLRRTESALIGQLQQIKTSRPDHKPVHFGAVRRQQQLRSARES